MVQINLRKSKITTIHRDRLYDERLCKLAVDLISILWQCAISGLNSTVVFSLIVLSYIVPNESNS